MPPPPARRHRLATVPHTSSPAPASRAPRSRRGCSSRAVLVRVTRATRGVQWCAPTDSESWCPGLRPPRPAGLRAPSAYLECRCEATAAAAAAARGPCPAATLVRASVGLRGRDGFVAPAAPPRVSREWALPRPPLRVTLPAPSTPTKNPPNFLSPGAASGQRGRLCASVTQGPSLCGRVFPRVLLTGTWAGAPPFLELKFEPLGHFWSRVR